jgi:large subunit ribosomal protein L24
MHIKSNDMVEVITGDDRGVRGKVLRVNRQAGKVIVEGVNRVYKHVRRSQRNPQGGRLSKEMPVQISNVLLVCPKCGQPARTGARFLDDGRKERYCKKCGAGTGDVAPARAAHAKKK